MPPTKTPNPPPSTPPPSSSQPPNPTPAPSSSPPETRPTPTASHDPPPPRRRPLLLALSGPTSSGKTSLATALHAIYPPPHSILLHADDFYKADEEIPFVDIDIGAGAGCEGEEGEGGASGCEGEEAGARKRVRDWDCAQALDLEALEGVVRGLKFDLGGGEKGDGAVAARQKQGNFESEGGGDGGIKGISQSLISRLRSSFPSSSPPPAHNQPPLIILDGFLLFGTSVPPSLTSLFDIKILLRVSREKARERRERRNGYVTLEGFWEDPEGYFEGVVWPGYEREYGGVEGRVGGGGGGGGIGGGGGGGVAEGGGVGGGGGGGGGWWGGGGDWGWGGRGF